MVYRQVLEKGNTRATARLYFNVHKIKKGGGKMSWCHIIGEALKALSVRLHVESCKECKKKYIEIVKHAKEEIERHETVKN